MSVPPALLPQVPDRDGLRMRFPRETDLQALHDAVSASIDDLRPWMPWAQSVPELDETRAVIRRMQDDIAARLDLPMQLWELDGGGREQRIVGGTGLHRIDWALGRFEIGYWRRSGCEGRGLALAAVNAMTRMAFDRLGARRVEIRMDVRNAASIRVAERAGFTFEGVLRQDSIDVQGNPRDTRVYARVRGVEEP